MSDYEKRFERMMFCQLADRIIFRREEEMVSAEDPVAWARLITIADLAGIDCATIARETGMPAARVREWKIAQGVKTDAQVRKVMEYLRKRVLRNE